MKTLMMLALVLGVGLAGCTKDSKQADQGKTGNPPAQDQAQGQPAADTQTPAQTPPAQTTPPVEKQQPAPVQQSKPKSDPQPARPKKIDTPPESQAQQAQPVTRLIAVEAGSEVPAALDETVSTETYQAGRTVTATLTEPYMVNGVTAFPAGTRVRGDVSFSKRAERVGGAAQLTIELKTLTIPDGRTYTLTAKPLAFEGKSTAGGDVKKVLGGAVGGAIVGGILGGKGGAVKGGAAGAAAGGAWAVATRGNDIVLDAGYPIKVVLDRALDVQVTVPAGQPVP
jgi:hypothetical protein